MTGMDITTLALMNISPKCQFSPHIAAAGELFTCVFDVYLIGELCYSFGDAGNAIKKGEALRILEGPRGAIGIK